MVWKAQFKNLVPYKYFCLELKILFLDILIPSSEGVLLLSNNKKGKEACDVSASLKQSNCQNFLIVVIIILENVILQYHGTNHSLWQTDVPGSISTILD